jgi:hypothetical protein
MDKYERFAVEHHLSDWPKELSFDELMIIMYSQDEDLQQEIWPWEPLEYFQLMDIAVLIKSMANKLRKAFS